MVHNNPVRSTVPIFNLLMLASTREHFSWAKSMAINAKLSPKGEHNVQSLNDRTWLLGKGGPHASRIGCKASRKKPPQVQKSCSLVHDDNQTETATNTRICDNYDTTQDEN